MQSKATTVEEYLTGIYMSEEARQDFEKRYKATGKRFDVGKSCVRFRKLEDLPLELIGETIEAIPVDRLIQRFEVSGLSARKAKKK